MKMATWCLKVCLAGFLANCLLSLFSLAYFYNGMHKPNPSGATDFCMEPNQIIVDQKEGHAILRLDAQGFSNMNADFNRPVDTLLMGDSQMQATHVPMSENPASHLNRLLKNQYTYNIALGDHRIYTCVKNMDNALREYEPTTCVLIDTTTVHLDFTKMRDVIRGTYATIPSHNAGMIVLLQKILPDLEVLYKQIDDWLAMENEGQEEMDSQYSPTPEEYEEILNAFLRKAAGTASAHGVRLLVFYIPQTEITSEGEILFQTDPDALAGFMQACERWNIIFCDMTKAFERLYSEQHVLPYGFVNTRVGKGHMNRYGYRVVADELAAILNDLDEQGE